MLRRRQLLLFLFSGLGLIYVTGYFFIAFTLTTSETGTIVDAQWRLLDVQQKLFYQLKQYGNLLQIDQTTKTELKKLVTLPVLVMTCNRPGNLERTLSQVIKYTSSDYRPSHVSLPLIISQDCGDNKTTQLIRTFYKHNITHLEQPDRSDLGVNKTKTERRFLGYYNIARHYKWALSQVLVHLNHSAVIIIEDDLDLSEDFFEYFIGTLPILMADSTLWCVSAWNDNGKIDHVSADSELLYRSDFFPGLGWMLLQQTWLELLPSWPAAFWDDWMRKPSQRKSRACIRPEIPRSSTFGRLGTSNGQFFDTHLKYIQHYKGFVNFTNANLTYLMQEHYDKDFLRMVYSKPLVSLDDVVRKLPPQNIDACRLEYSDLSSFKKLATKLGLMSDCKAGVPRMAYKGIVSSVYQGMRIYVCPLQGWSGYDESWT